MRVIRNRHSIRVPRAAQSAKESAARSVSCNPRRRCLEPFGAGLPTVRAMNPAAKAHAILAELLASGEIVAAESTGTAKSEEHGLQVVVILAPYKPLRLDPESAAELKRRVAALGQPEPVTPNLRQIEQDALDASPGPNERPCSVKALAAKAGYSCHSHFREAVRRLEVLGLIRRVPGGVRKA